MAPIYKLPLPDAPLLLKDEAAFEILIRTGNPVDPNLDAKSVKALLCEILTSVDPQDSSEPKQVPVTSREVPIIEFKLDELQREVEKFSGKAQSKTYRKLDTRLDHLTNRITLLADDATVRTKFLTQVLNIHATLESKTDLATDSELSDQELEQATTGDSRLHTVPTLEDAHGSRSTLEGQNMIIQRRRTRTCSEGSEGIYEDAQDVAHIQKTQSEEAQGLPQTFVSYHLSNNYEDARRMSGYSQNADAHFMADNFIEQDETIRRVSAPTVHFDNPPVIPSSSPQNCTQIMLPESHPLSRRSDRQDTLLPNQESQTPNFSQPSKGLDLHKWQLKFSGDDSKESLASFLCRVDDKCRSRNISPEFLYQNCAELFEGSALVWYRAFRDSFTGWAGLITKLKIAFQDRDYDYKLKEEIRSRKQGKDESVSIFIAKMLNLFSRLSHPLSAEEQLEIIEHNILPYYQRPLALSPHRNIEELHSFLLRIEIGEARSVHHAGTNVRILEPDLQPGCTPMVNSNNSSIPLRSHRVAAMDDSQSYYPQHPERPRQLAIRNFTPRPHFRPANSAVGECWNCGGPHKFRNCNQPWNLFCHRCGFRDARSRDCPRCQGKDGRPRSAESRGREPVENLRPDHVQPSSPES